MHREFYGWAIYFIPILLYPQINIGTGSNGAISKATDAALGKTLSPPFSPYANNVAFLIGAFIFEDVGVTPYQA